MELSLFEREVSAARKDSELRLAVRSLLAESTRVFDIVLVDCPPGLSLLTECWLREVDYFIPPTKPDYLAVRGLDILKKFREQYAKDSGAASEDDREIALAYLNSHQKEGEAPRVGDWQMLKPPMRLQGPPAALSGGAMAVSAEPPGQ